jgi:hypothetical protein
MFTPGIFSRRGVNTFHVCLLSTVDDDDGHSDIAGLLKIELKNPMKQHIEAAIKESKE